MCSEWKKLSKYKWISVWKWTKQIFRKIIQFVKMSYYEDKLELVSSRTSSCVKQWPVSCSPHTFMNSKFSRILYPITTNLFTTSDLRNFVIEGVACQLPSSLRSLQATPLFQTSLKKILFCLRSCKNFMLRLT